MQPKASWRRAASGMPAAPRPQQGPAGTPPWPPHFNAWNVGTGDCFWTLGVHTYIRIYQHIYIYIHRAPTARIPLGSSVNFDANAVPKIQSFSHLRNLAASFEFWIFRFTDLWNFGWMLMFGCLELLTLRFLDFAVFWFWDLGIFGFGTLHFWSC